MVTVKVWQLLLLGLTLVVALAFLALKPGAASTPSAEVAASATGFGPAQQAQLANLQLAIPRIAEWGAKHNGYARLRMAGAVTVVRASKVSYCVETSGPEPHVFQNGPSATPLLGSCRQPSLGKPVS